MSKAGVLEGGEQVNTLSFTPASHSLVCSCAALVTQLFFQMKAVPTPRMDLDTSNVFKIHKKLSIEQAELKSNPSFPRSFLG